MTPRLRGANRTLVVPFFGYESALQLTGIGFASAAGPPKVSRRRAAVHTGRSHILTIGATGSGKTNLLIANLLQYAGSAIVIDIRGDAVLVTERYRRQALGQATYVLDPFSVTGKPQARLNPLDVAHLPNVEIESECQSLAATLVADHRSSRDPYWARKTFQDYSSRGFSWRCGFTT